MKKLSILVSSLVLLVSISAFSQTSGKLVSEKANIKFFSHTTVEDIQANNNTSVGTINKATGEVVFQSQCKDSSSQKPLCRNISTAISSSTLKHFRKLN